MSNIDMKRIIFNDVIFDFHFARERLIKILREKNIKKVAIWGAGLSGEVVFYLIQGSNIKVSHFYDTYKKGQFLGLDILNPYEQLNQIPIIIASSKPIEKLQNIIELLKEKKVDFFITNNLKYKLLNLNYFRSIHKNERCFVIGNGPSLNSIDMTKLSDEITIGSNRIYLGFEKWKLNLKYWVIEDELVAEDTAHEWNALDEPIMFIPEDLSHLLNKLDNVCLIKFLREKFEDEPKFFDGFNFYWGGTVSYLMLQISAFMGCNPIYMIGMDFNYKKPTHVSYGRNKTEWISHGDDPNHFDPNYFGNGRKWHDPNLKRMEKAFITAKRNLEKLGIKVFNATHKSKLEVFDFIDYEKLF